MEGGGGGVRTDGRQWLELSGEEELPALIEVG